MRNISPRPPSYGAMIADSLKPMRMRGRVSRAMSSPNAMTSVIGPRNDSRFASQFAVEPYACISPVPVVVKTPMLKVNARRKGSVIPIASVPRSAPSPSAR